MEAGTSCGRHLETEDEDLGLDAKVTLRWKHSEYI